MKKTAIIGLLALLSALQAPAQEAESWWTVMPKAALSLANIAGSDIYINLSDDKVTTSTKAGLAIGAEAEYHNGRMDLSAGVLYSQQGASYGDVPQMWRDQALRLHYLNIPVLLHGYITPQIGIEAGLQPGFLLGAKLKGEEYGSDNAYHAFASTDLYYRTFSLGIPVGVTYDVGPLRLGLRYTFGLRDITKVELKERNKVAQLSVAYRFDW